MAVNRRGYQVLGYLVLALMVAWITNRQAVNTAVIQTDQIQNVNEYEARGDASLQAHSRQVPGSASTEDLMTSRNITDARLVPRMAPPDEGRGPRSHLNIGLPWWLEQLRVRGEQANTWLRSENRDPWTQTDAENAGWRTVWSGSSDADISQGFTRHRPASDQSNIGLFPLIQRQREEMFGNALKCLRDRMGFTKALDAPWLTYQEKESMGIKIGGMTCANYYEDGWIWSYKSSGLGTDLGEWSQLLSYQWGASDRNQLIAHSHSVGDLEADKKKLNNIVLVRESDQSTLAVVYWILSNWDPHGPPKRKDLLSAWSPQNTGRKIVMSPSGRDAKKAAMALLGTPSGLKAARAAGLVDGRSTRRILDSVIIFKDDKCHAITDADRQTECRPTLIFRFKKVLLAPYLPEVVFPDTVPTRLGDQNPYAILAREQRPTDAQWESYMTAAKEGRLDEQGDPTEHEYGHGPARPNHYYTARGKERLGEITGYQPRAPYALPGRGRTDRSAGPKAGVLCTTYQFVDPGPGAGGSDDHDPGEGPSNQGGGHGGQGSGGGDMDIDEDADAEGSDDSQYASSQGGGGGDMDIDEDADAEGSDDSQYAAGSS